MPAALSRVAAPAVFLLAATIVLLLVRASLRDEAPAPPRAAAAVPAAASPRPAARRPARPTAPAAEAQEFYEIRAGDTLGGVADRHETSVEALVGLNPGVDPTALQVGQRIRVK